MARGDRTPVYVAPQIEAVITLLSTIEVTPDTPFPIREWQRPKDNDQRFEPPPFLLVRAYPSSAQYSGSLADSQVDTILRVQLLGVGHTELEALNVTDWARTHMQRDALEDLIPDRAVMDLSCMVVSGGASRDDDLPTPFFYSTDLYELWTTPDPEPVS